MSASRDKTQKIGFVFSNLYQLYKKGKENAETFAIHRESAGSPASAEPAQPGLTTGAVLKARAVGDEASTYNPAEFIGKRVARPPVLPSSAAVASLRENLRALNDLHGRLRFMLAELEELVKD